MTGVELFLAVVFFGTIAGSVWLCWKHYNRVEHRHPKEMTR
jgi:hypothetical protein